MEIALYFSLTVNALLAGAETWLMLDVAAQSPVAHARKSERHRLSACSAPFALAADRIPGTAVRVPGARASVRIGLRSKSCRRIRRPDALGTGSPPGPFRSRADR